MRIDVDKFLFVGPRAQWGAFFEVAQEVGIIQFIDPTKKGRAELPEVAQLLYDAHKVLKRYPQQSQEATTEPAPEVAQRIIQLKEQLDIGLEEERLIFQELPRIEPFGDFSLEDRLWVERETHLALQFFCAKQGRAVGVEEDPELLWVNQAYGLDYYVRLSRQPRQIPGLTEIRVNLPVSKLKARLEELMVQRRELESELRQLTAYDQYLQEALLDQLDGHHLTTAMQSADHPLDGQLFGVQGWVPRNRVAQLPETFSRLSVHWDKVVPDASDKVPTYLRNPGVARIGQDLIAIYDTPSIADADPSLWVLAFFALFFAMILGDGGYGALIMAGAGFALWKWRRQLQGQSRRMVQLFFLLGVVSTLWGVFFNSFFGLPIAPDSPLRSVSVLQWASNRAAAYHLQHGDSVLQKWTQSHPELAGATSSEALLHFETVSPDGHVHYVIADELGDEFLLELSLVLGVIHIIISFLRNLRRHWSGIGWILFLIGGYLYFPTYLKVTSMIHYILGIDPVWAGAFGFQLLFAGIALACILALFQHKWRGAEEPVKLIQIFADIFSYLRLYALGLAGAMMAQTFNRMAADVGLVFGLLVLLLGHGVNIIMSVGSCFIHGLRLNFIEWYHYSFEGGGYRFLPLKLSRQEQ